MLSETIGRVYIQLSIITEGAGKHSVKLCLHYAKRKSQLQLSKQHNNNFPEVICLNFQMNSPWAGLSSNNIPFPAAFCQFNSLDSCGKDTSRTLELGRFSVCLIIVPFCGLQTHCIWISINDKALSLKGRGKAILSIISSKKILSVQKHLADWTSLN